MGKRPITQSRKQPLGQTIKKFFNRKVEKRIGRQQETANVIDLCDKEDESTITGAAVPKSSGYSRSPSPYSARPASSNSAPLLSPAHTVRQDGQQQPPQPESEEQRVVYKSSPTQRSPSEPPEAAPSLSGRQLSADEDTLRQRLISAMQRPSGTENAGQLADSLSLRCLEENRSYQTMVTSTPHCTVRAINAAGTGSGTPGEKPSSRSKSFSKTPSEHVRSGSAVKRSQTLAFGSPLGSQRKRRGTPVRRANREGQRSSSGGKIGPSTAKRQKRKALLDILERVEVAVKEAKEDNTEDEDTGEAALRKTASSSFERVSQEIEKASQELPQAKQPLSSQPSRPNNILAQDMLPGVNHQAEAPQHQSGRRDRDHAPALGTGSQAKHPIHSTAQRMPLEPLDEHRSHLHQQAGRSSQDSLRPSSQHSDSALSRGTTQSISEVLRPPPVQSTESRQPPGQQAPLCVGVRVRDAGHILPRSQEPGTAIAHGAAQHQRPVQHTARGLHGAALPHRQPQGSLQQGSHRGPPQHRRPAGERTQQASQPARAQASAGGPAPVQVLPGAGPARSRAWQRAPDTLQHQHNELRHQGTSEPSHAPSRSGQHQALASRPDVQPVRASQAQQQQQSGPESSVHGLSKLSAGVSQALRELDSRQQHSDSEVSRQAFMASQAQQHQAVPPSGLPRLARHESARQIASGPNSARTCGLGTAVSSSRALHDIQPPEIWRNRPAPAAGESTGVFAGKSTGVFADGEDDEEEDADWEAEVAKLLEKAALSRPHEEAQQTTPQEQPCFSGRADLAEAVRAAPPVPATSLPAEQAAPVRYRVQKIITGEYEKQLVVRVHASGTEPPHSRDIMVHLQDGWIETPAEVGDIVHVLAHLQEADGASNDMQHALCNSLSGMLVLQPDVLLSGTRIAGSFKCPRLSFLEERFGGDSNEKAVEGTLLHDLLQAALGNGCATAESLHHTVKQVIQNNAEKLLEVGMKESEAEKVMTNAIPALLTWLHKFQRREPDRGATLEVRDQKHGSRMEAVAIPEVVDIEESIWVPRYGLKGMIDASVQLRCQPVGPHGPMQALQDYTAPLEFKTGRAHQSHRAQVTLYQLLMEERYGRHIERGLLWYLREASPEVVTRSPYEVASLIMQRNVLAARLGRNRSLPPVLGDPHACSRCFQVSNCSLLHKAVECGDSNSAGMGDAFEQHTHLMQPAHAQFLAHWLQLVDLEEGDLSAKRAEIWALPGEERERKGRCVAGLHLTSEQSASAARPPEKHAWLYCFRRQPGAVQPSSTAGVALRDSCLVEGDMVILSIEGRHAGMARGIVKQLSGEEISVTLDKRLRRAFGPEPQHSAASSVEDVKGKSTAQAQGEVVDSTSQRHSWRLDKDEVASVFVRLRRNLMGLFTVRDSSGSRLREVIVDLAAPISERAQGQSTAAPCPAVESALQKSGLNAEQEDAVRRIVNARDYALLLGMPGTGKSSTIVQAVIALRAAGRSVVLMSYTNSAVDNLLLKLAAEGVPFLRIGRLSQVDQRLHTWTPGGSRYPNTSVGGLQATAKAAQVVGCTSLSASHPLLQGRLFDMCIVDEAGQITLPAVLGAVLRAHQFALVGDHHQLPPLVQNPAAAEQGLDCSLFRRLCEAHPQAVVTLRTQYRMCADIMAIANELTYDGQLRCGSPLVEQGMLAQTAPIPESLPDWLRQVLEPKRRVLLLDTSALPGAEESQAGDQLSNPAEAAMIMRIVESLLEAGIQPGAIGVISAYRSQVALIQRLAKQRGWSSLEALTIDRCQGRDKDVILVSMVRNNKKQHAGKILADERRINVALTRAKLKLIMLGAQRTLCSVPVMQRLWELCSRKGWTLPLSPKS